MSQSSTPVVPEFGELEQYRPQLTAHCYRMLGSPFEAEDAVQETLVRAWRNAERFEGRSAVSSWLYRIATNVCLDMAKSSQRRATPMDLGPAREPIAENLYIPAEARWIEPLPDSLITTGQDPAQVAEARESVRLALVAALQHLPARQRAVLILREVLHWEASEVAGLLETTVASVNSALQRARATLASRNLSPGDAHGPLTATDRKLLERYVVAFQRYDLSGLTELIREDATMSMPPFDLWLSGRDHIFTWFLGPGIHCKGSRILPTAGANGLPAYGQYKPNPDGGFDPWALMVVQLSDGQVSELTFFLDTARLFPLFGLPARLDA